MPASRARAPRRATRASAPDRAASRTSSRRTGARPNRNTRGPECPRDRAASASSSDSAQPFLHLVVGEPALEVAAQPDVVAHVLHRRLRHAAPPHRRLDLMAARPLLECFLVA